jgi:hypothetical protein
MFIFLSYQKFVSDSAKVAEATISPGNKEDHAFPKNRFLGSLKFYKFELSAGIFKQSMSARNRV